MACKVGSRVQMTFFPPVIDDYVTDEDPVRVYDVFVDALACHGHVIPTWCDDMPWTFRN